MIDNALLASAAQDAAQSSTAAALQSRASKLAAAQSPEKVKETAKKFEAFFVGQMMEYMSAGLKADKTFGGGQAEETWRSLLNQEYGKEISKSGKLGISDMISKEMIKMQEKRSAAAAAGVEDAAPAESAPEAAEPTATHRAIVAAAGAARYAQAAAM